MSISAPTTAVGADLAPTILSFSRAHMSAAKLIKNRYWLIETLAAALAVVASLLPWPDVAAVVAVISVGVKATSKLTLSRAKRAFRLGERARRYDFYAKTLGWPVPPVDRADMALANASKPIEEAARKLASAEPDYYARKGPPSTERLLCNLAESMFWSERLLGHMAKARWKLFAVSAVAVIAALVGTIVMNSVDGLHVLKYLGSVVALLVAVDVFGEAQSFGRGERETGRLLSALVTEMNRQAPARDEGLRLMVEYNCLLADLPMISDRLYEDRKSALNDAWKEFASALPCPGGD